MPTSNTTGRESTHASTLRGGATKKSRAPDPESVQRFAETLRLRSLAAATQEEYLRFVRKLVSRHGGDPAALDEAAVRAHLLHLKDAHHYSPSSMRTAVAAMRAYYGLHLGRGWKLFDLVRSPSAQKLPAVLTRAEVARLFAVVREPRFRTLFRLIYACGLRIGDGARQRGDGHASRRGPQRSAGWFGWVPVQRAAQATTRSTWRCAICGCRAAC